MSKWIVKKESANIELMAETMKISQITAQVMVNRNIRTKNTATKYLNPNLSYLNPISRMKDISKAIEIVCKSINLKEKIVVYGDYDVDGVTSTTILYKALKKLGADVSFYIPHREHEGYGLNLKSIKNIIEAETDLLITCDNGISALEEIKQAKNSGMKVIVIDHHEPSFLENEKNIKVDILPVADAIIDPKQSDCTYPFKSLCAGGLSYIFVKELYSYTNTPFAEEKEFLVLSMIATFCDIVDLQDDNRIIAKYGLHILNTNININKGLAALIKEKGYYEKQITEFVIGFIIGPCINATGRLEKATIAVDLLTTDNDEKATLLAKKLVELNEIRKNMTANATESSIANIMKLNYNESPVIVLFDKNIHESIAGIVAGRIKDMFYKPTIVITDGEHCAKGSARSIEGYNIFEELYNCRHLFNRFGGHAMAAGLSIEKENIDILRETLNKTCTLTEDNFVEKIYVDDELSLDEVTYEEAFELTKMSPFGKGNKEPLFLSRSISPSELRVIEEKNTLIFTFLIPDSFRKLKGICFGQVENFKQQISLVYDEYECNKILNGILRNSNFKMDIIYSMEINEYNNNSSVQIRIRDFIIY